MSTTYIAVIVSLLSAILPKLGLEIGNDALTTTVSTLLTVGASIWILYKRHQTGDITALGRKK